MTGRRRHWRKHAGGHHGVLRGGRGWRARGWSQRAAGTAWQRAHLAPRHHAAAETGLFSTEVM